MKLRQWLPFKHFIALLAVLTFVLPTPLINVEVASTSAPHACACSQTDAPCICEHDGPCSAQVNLSSGCSAETEAGKQSVLRNRLNEWAVLFEGDSFKPLTLLSDSLLINNPLWKSADIAVELKPPKKSA